jgi:hypothetical protein
MGSAIAHFKFILVLDYGLEDRLAEEMRSPTLDSFTRFAVRPPLWIVLRGKCDRLHPITLWFWSAIAYQPDFSLRSLIYYQDASSSVIASLDIKRRKSRISTKTSFASLE